MKLIRRERPGRVGRMAAALVVLALFAVSPHAAAQQAARTPRIGLLILTSASSGAGAAGIQALRASLADLGYVEDARSPSNIDRRKGDPNVSPSSRPTWSRGKSISSSAAEAMWRRSRP